MTLLELKWYAGKMIQKHPDKRHDIHDLLSLAADEVDDGASEYHECELAAESIRQLCNEESDES